jgi:hypothetical protein
VQTLQPQPRFQPQSLPQPPPVQPPPQQRQQQSGTMALGTAQESGAQCGSQPMGPQVNPMHKSSRAIMTSCKHVPHAALQLHLASNAFRSLQTLGQCPVKEQDSIHYGMHACYPTEQPVDSHAGCGAVHVCVCCWPGAQGWVGQHSLHAMRLSCVIVSIYPLPGIAGAGEGGPAWGQPGCCPSSASARPSCTHVVRVP